jgi:hypothetical protein
LSAKPLFLVGNKRSGSTLLVNMLNEHPQLAVTHESDVVWALFQCRLGVPVSFQPYSWDASRGLDALIDAYGARLRELSPLPLTVRKVREAFFDIQRQVIERGTKIHVPLKGVSGLSWIGDKKPVQHATPEIRDFILEIFPDAKFVHVIRHPWAVVASKQAAARTWPVVPEYWKGSTSEILDRWRIHEQWVLELKELTPNRVHTVRLEDVSVDPREEISKLFTFLRLESPHELIERLASFVYSSPNAKYSSNGADATLEVHHIMETYGYKP